MINLDSCRYWRCTSYPCKLRNTFPVNFWNCTILLCIPCIMYISYIQLMCGREYTYINIWTYTLPYWKPWNLPCSCSGYGPGTNLKMSDGFREQPDTRTALISVFRTDQSNSWLKRLIWSFSFLFLLQRDKSLRRRYYVTFMRPIGIIWSIRVERQGWTKKGDDPFLHLDRNLWRVSRLQEKVKCISLQTWIRS
jgi:hypothetical protein